MVPPSPVCCGAAEDSAYRLSPELPFEIRPPAPPSGRRVSGWIRCTRLWALAPLAARATTRHGAFPGTYQRRDPEHSVLHAVIRTPAAPAEAALIVPMRRGLQGRQIVPGAREIPLGALVDRVWTAANRLWRLPRPIPRILCPYSPTGCAC